MITCRHYLLPTSLTFPIMDNGVLSGEITHCDEYGLSPEAISTHFPQIKGAINLFTDTPISPAQMTYFPSGCIHQRVNLFELQLNKPGQHIWTFLDVSGRRELKSLAP